eukprot:1514868-Rhodomonas_salina.2
MSRDPPPPSPRPPSSPCTPPPSPPRPLQPPPPTPLALCSPAAARAPVSSWSAPAASCARTRYPRARCQRHVTKASSVT